MTVGPPAVCTAGSRRALSLFFVGTTNPVLGWRRLVEGTRRLAGGLGAGIVVANTSGLLAGPGRRLKAAKIEALRPDLLVALGEGRDLDAVLSDHPGLPVLRLPPSPEARRKSEGEKRSARREAFRGYFAQGSVRRFDRRRLGLEGADLPPRLLLGLLADDGGHDLGILVGSCDGTLDILTPAAGDRVRRITPGSLCLDDAFHEQRVRPAP